MPLAAFCPTPQISIPEFAGERNRVGLDVVSKALVIGDEESYL